MMEMNKIVVMASEMEEACKKLEGQSAQTLVATTWKVWQSMEPPEKWGFKSPLPPLFCCLLDYLPNKYILARAHSIPS